MQGSYPTNTKLFRRNRLGKMKKQWASNPMHSGGIRRTLRHNSDYQDVRVVTLHFPFRLLPDNPLLVEAFPVRLLSQLPRLCLWKLGMINDYRGKGEEEGRNQSRGAEAGAHCSIHHFWTPALLTISTSFCVRKGRGMRGERWIVQIDSAK